MAPFFKRLQAHVWSIHGTCPSIGLQSSTWRKAMNLTLLHVEVPYMPSQHHPPKTARSTSRDAHNSNSQLSLKRSEISSGSKDRRVSAMLPIRSNTHLYNGGCKSCRDLGVRDAAWGLQANVIIGAWVGSLQHVVQGVDSQPDGPVTFQQRALAASKSKALLGAACFQLKQATEILFARSISSPQGAIAAPVRCRAARCTYTAPR